MHRVGNWLRAKPAKSVFWIHGLFAHGGRRKSAQGGSIQKNRGGNLVVAQSIPLDQPQRFDLRMGQRLRD